MTTLIIKIEKETPEVKKTLEYLNSLAGVSIASHKGVKEKNESTWNQAVAEGAITVDAFIDEVKQQLKTYYDNA
jgi:hypothetical protein